MRLLPQGEGEEHQKLEVREGNRRIREGHQEEEHAPSFHDGDDMPIQDRDTGWAVQAAGPAQSVGPAQAVGPAQSVDAAIESPI